MPELRPCRDCGTLVEAPVTVCSDLCFSEVYGESKADYDDERHPTGIESDPMEDYAGDGETETE